MLLLNCDVKFPFYSFHLQNDRIDREAFTFSALMLLTLPGFSARRMFSIVIASTTARGCPASTASLSPTGGVGVAGSNPVVPTNYFKYLEDFLDPLPALVWGLVWGDFFT